MRALRLVGLAVLVLFTTLALNGAASFATPAALTVTPISWTVVGLDSNSPSSATLPHIYPVGARVCNTGSVAATNVSTKWTWGDTTGTNTVDGAFSAPAQNTTQTIGTLAGAACQDVYFNVDVKQSGGNSSKTHSQNQNIIATADGGLSASETKLVYVESLVSQNRNQVKAWSGVGGCNLTFTTCDPAPTHIYVGQSYTYKLYAQTSTAYDELEAFATWPSFITLNSASSTLSTVTSPGTGSSTSIWADACTWGSMTSASSGACGTAGKAGGSVVVTYKVTPTAAGTATAIQPMIYDHSGSSFHYNSGYTTALEAIEADWKLSASVTGNGMVTTSPNGYTSTGVSAAISCGTTGTTCDVGYAANTSVTLTATPGSGQVFTGWSGGSCTGTSTTCTVTMNQARTVAAAFTGQTYYPLTVTKYGSGTVTAGDSSISCGTTCSASYASGTSVTLTATAATNWKFSGWSGDCASSGTSPTCTVSVTQARSVTAQFDEKTYTLTVTSTGTGAGNLCSNNSNQTASGVCSPSTESVFISCGSSTSTTNYTDTICSGTFPAGQAETLYPMCNGGTSGTPCPGGSGASTVSFGGYTGGTCTGNATTGCAITMDQDRTVNANFVLGNSATPDLTIAKSHTGNFSQGDTGKTYTLTVSNVGTGASYTGKTITVTDTPPTGLTITGMSGTGWTCTVATKTCTQTLSSNLAAGASLNAITVTVSVASNASTPLANTASVACSASCTDDTTNDTASDSTTILTPSDLTLTKSHTGNFTQGGTGDWTMTVTNSGGQATSGAVTVTDALPSGFTKSAITGTGWDCTASTATNVSCTRSDALAATSSYPAIDVTANVGATAVTATNTASVAGGGETNTGNDSASDPTTVVTSLSVATAGAGSGSVADDLSSISCGSTCSATYDTGTVVTLTETPATGTTFTGWSGDIGSCTATASTCQVTMSQARSITATFALQTFTLSVATSGTGTGTVTSDVGGISCTTNLGTCSKTYAYGTTVTLTESPAGGSTFTAWSGGCTPSGATCAVTMTQNASVGAQFDLGTSPLLTVAKSHLGDFHQGDTGDHYTVSVANAGTGASSGTVTVTDSVPAGLTPTAASGTGWSCAISGQTVTCTRSDALAASASYADITLTVSVASDALSSVTNSVSVSGGGCASSPCGTATDPTTIVQDPRLSLSKSHTGTFHQGDAADGYTITVSNGSGTEAGPTSGAVTVSDSMPSGLTPASATGTGWSCSISGQTITCTRSDALARGASYPSIDVTAGVASDATSSVTNTATVSGGGCTSSPCASASDPTTVGQDPRLSISKSHTGSFHQGDTGDGYSITVSNGPGSEVGSTSGTVTVTDAVPAGLTPTAASGTGWSCSLSGQTVTCTRSDALARGASYAAIGVTVNVASDALSSITNTASVSGGGCTSSPCATASDPTTIGQDARLAISKSHSGSFHQGDSGDTYTLAVSNGSGTEVGPTTGTVTAADAVPSGLTPTAASGTGWSCGISGQVVTCTRSDALARGASYASITVTVDVAADASSLTNTATVSGGGCTASPCATASDPTTVVQDPRLSIAKSHSGSFHQGDAGDAYTLAVANGGGAEVGPTRGTVTVTDAVPSGLTPAAATGTGWSCSLSGQTVTCTRSDVLAAGGSYPSVTVTVDVAADAASSVTNSASVSGGGCTSSPCATASDPTTIVQDPRLAIAKSHSGSFHQGDTGDSYSIAVSNGSGTEVGPTRSTVTVTDVVPSGLTPTGASGTGWSCSLSGQTVTCTRSDALARGASYPNISVSVDVAADAPSSLTNSASVSGGGCTSSPCGTASDATTIVQDPRLAIAKTHSGNFGQGDSGDTYTIAVSNGSGSEVGPTRSTVTVADTLPSGLTPTAASGTGWTCGISGQAVTCTRSDALARGTSYSDITVTVDVAANASSTTNTATVSGGGCTSSPCATASDPTTIVQDPHLSISKSHSGTFHQGDGGDAYTLSVSNASGAGVGPTRGLVTVADAVPSGLTPTAASGTGWSCAVVAQSVSCTRSDVLAAGASYPDITLSVDVAADAPASVTNSATVYGGGCASSPCGTASDPTTIVQDPRLAIAKSHSGSFHQGDTGDAYTLSVSNGSGTEVGPTRSTVTVTDPVPSGLTPTAASGTGWSCSISGQTVTCTRSDALARGASYPDVTVTVDVAAAASSSITNSASVSGGGCTSSPCGTASDPTTVVQDPRLAISKTHSGNFGQGDTGATYTIAVSNGSGSEVGPTRSTVTVADTLPSGLTPTAASGTGWSCSISGQAVTCTRSDSLARGASYPNITVTVDVAANATSTTNTATVSGGGCTASPCDSASDPTTIVQDPRLSVSKSHSGSFHQGDTGDAYTLSVSNASGAGVGPTRGTVTLTDSAPAGLAPAAASGTGWSCSVSGQTVTCTRSDVLAAGASYPDVTVSVDVAADAAASLTNSASVSGGGCASSPCGTASDPTTIVQDPRLAIAKSHSGSFHQGDTGDSYSIAVSNGSGTEVGPTRSTVTVTDVVPSGLTPTAASGTGWSCSLSGQTVTCTRSDALARGASYPSIGVSVDVAADADASITNTASVSGGGCTASPCGTASDPTTVVQDPRLAIAKTHSGSFHQGDTADTYAISVSNGTGTDTGPTRSAVTVTDNVPLGLTPTGAAGTGWSCGIAGQTVTCSRSDALARGASYPDVTVTVGVATDASSSLTNTADVSGGGCTASPCDATSDPTTVGQDPRLSIAKSHTGTFHQGDTGDTYAIVVSNGSGSEVGGTHGTTTVSDAVPVALTPTGASGTGWSCSISGQTVTCTRSDVLARGASYPTITVTVDVDASAASSVTNTASVSGGGCTSSPCGTASDPTTIVQDPRLAIAKSHSGSFHQGDSGDSYTLAVSNGSSAATGPTRGTVTVTDAVPSGLTPTGASGSGWSCSVSGQTVTCTRSDALARGASYPDITVSVDVAADAAASITNSASVSGGGCAASPCGTASDPTTVVQDPRLAIAKSHTGSFHQGDTGEYTLSVSNGSGSEVGPTRSTVTVTDPVPAGLTPTGASGTGWSCGVAGQAVTCTRSDALARGASYPDVTVSVDVAADAPASVTNTASVSGGGCTSSPCGTASDPTTIVQDPRLSIAKSHTGSFHQRDTGDAYALSVSNGAGSEVGPTRSTVTVTDAVPSGLTPTGATGTGWSCSVSGQTVTCTRADVLARGASYPDVTVSVDVAADADASVTNTATVSGGGCTSSPCGSASDPTTIVQDPRLAIAKSHSGSFHQGDTGDTYAILVSNGSGNEVGPTRSTVTVTDAVPSGLTPTAASGTGWSCSVSGQTVTCSRSDVLARGASYAAITVSVDVAADADASITNSASVDGGGCVASPCATASDPTTIVQDPRLSISKSHNGSFRQRETGDRYTISVANGSGNEVGPTRSAVTVTDAVPSGLTPTGASGTGWSCSVSGQTVTCSRSDVLARGASYPDISLSVDVAANAPSSLTNSASVDGGGCAASPCRTASDPTTIVPRYDLGAATTGSGTGTVSSDVGGVSCGATCTDTYDGGTVVTLTAAATSGSTFLGWTGDCTGSGATCAVTMNGARNVTAAFGRADLHLAKTALDTLRQGDTGDRYDLAVSNAGDGPTTSDVTVAEHPPAGLAVTSMSGTGWTCDLPTSSCVRSDALAAGGTFPSIRVLVDVAENADPSVTNVATVSGGGCTGSPCGSGTSSAPVAPVNGSISGRVFDHSTPGEPALQGWTVYLDSNGNGALDGGEPSTTTDATGDYRFGGLAHGGYDVREVLADGWTCATPAGCDYALTLASNAASSGNDFGNDAPPVPAPAPAPAPVADKPPLTADVPTAPAVGGASISGTVYSDLNADGTREIGEPGLAGWRVGLDLNGDGRIGSGEPSVKTGADGTYGISGLAAGTYTVLEADVATGWTCSDPTPCTHTVDAGATNVDFGDWAHALLRGHQYEDANRDGVHQPGEAPLGGWTVYVDYNGNGQLDAGEPSSVTQPDGYYGITAVAAGTWTVREVAQPDWTCSAPAACAYTLTFDANTELVGKDFLDWAPARATGTLWDDLSADAIRDPDDPGLAGWVVYVDYNGDGTLDAGDISTTTNAQGDYSMGVKPGDWTVREVRPAHWICDVPTPCARPGTFASGGTGGGDFGNYRLAMLSGTMFDDLNRNGTEQAGEPGLGGWKVYVDYNHNGAWDRGEPFDTTTGGTTGARGLSSAHGVPGHYTITGIEPGSWTIREVRHNGFPCTFPFTCTYGQHFLENSRIVHRDFATFKPMVKGSVSVAMPDTCVSGAFTVRVTTSAVTRLELDAKPGVHRVLGGHGAKHEVFVVKLDAAPSSVGAHQLVIRATFAKSSGTKPKRVVRVFYRCGKAAPPFTG